MQPNKSIFNKEHKMIVERLKRARLEIGLDQNQVAKMLKKTQSHVSKIESGQRRIDVIQLRELAKIYRKDVGYFIDLK